MNSVDTIQSIVGLPAGLALVHLKWGEMRLACGCWETCKLGPTTAPGKNCQHQGEEAELGNMDRDSILSPWVFLSPSRCSGRAGCSGQSSISNITKQSMRGRNCNWGTSTEKVAPSCCGEDLWLEVLFLTEVLIFMLSDRMQNFFGRQDSGKGCFSAFLAAGYIMWLDLSQ